MPSQERIDLVLHDFLDDVEGMREDTRSEVRSYLAGIDLLRFASPDDVAYDAEVRDAILAILLGAVGAAAILGRQTAGRVTGRPVSLEGPSPLVDRAASLTAQRLDDAIIDLGQGMDRWVARASLSGMSGQTIAETLERAILGPLTEGMQAIPLPFSAALKAVSGESVDLAVQHSAAMAQIEGQILAEAEPLTEPFGDDGFGSIRLAWFAALVNTCPDCLPRHNTIQSLDTWTEWGLPGTGWSVCTTHCMCELVSAEIVASNMPVLLRRPSSIKGRTERVLA